MPFMPGAPLVIHSPLEVLTSPVRPSCTRYFPNHDPELNAVIDGKYLVHDGRTGLVNTSSGLWITKGAPGMNGINGA
jgi:hypothetical protein